MKLSASAHTAVRSNRRRQIGYVTPAPLPSYRRTLTVRDNRHIVGAYTGTLCEAIGLQWTATEIRIARKTL
jgi:hypothetical protein